MPRTARQVEDNGYYHILTKRLTTFIFFLRLLLREIYRNSFKTCFSDTPITFVSIITTPDFFFRIDIKAFPLRRIPIYWNAHDT